MTVKERDLTEQAMQPGLRSRAHGAYRPARSPCGHPRVSPPRNTAILDFAWRVARQAKT